MVRLLPSAPWLFAVASLKSMVWRSRVTPFQPADRRSWITKNLDAGLDIPHDDAAGPHKRPVPDGNPRDHARMASKKYALSQDSAPVDAAMAADLAPIPDNCVVPHVAERPNRYMIANDDI